MRLGRIQRSLSIATITGGTIDGTVIGGTTPAAGSFITIMAGIGVPDGTAHIRTASAGAVIADADADDLTVENSTNAGITILTPNSSVGSLYFGDPDDNNAARIRYNHSSDVMTLHVNQIVNAGAASVTLNADKSVTFADNIVVSGTGPHVIGGATVDYVQLLQTGSFTSLGANNFAAAFRIATTLTGAIGDTSSLAHFEVNGSIITQGTDTNINVVAAAIFREPGITNNLASSGKPDVAATVYISSAPTEGDLNDALHVANGSTRLLGDLQHGGTNLGFYATTAIAQQTGVAVTDAAIHAACVALGLFTA